MEDFDDGYKPGDWVVVTLLSGWFCGPARLIRRGDFHDKAANWGYMKSYYSWDIEPLYPEEYVRLSRVMLPATSLPVSCGSCCFTKLSGVPVDYVPSRDQYLELFM